MLPEQPDQAARGGVRQGRSHACTYPDTAAILKTQDEGSAWDRWIFSCGELMLGTPGSIMVELAASRPS
jgi:hypothetical protein